MRALTAALLLVASCAFAQPAVPVSSDPGWCFRSPNIPYPAYYPRPCYGVPWWNLEREGPISPLTDLRWDARGERPTVSLYAWNDWSNQDPARWAVGVTMTQLRVNAPAGDDLWMSGVFRYADACCATGSDRLWLMISARGRDALGGWHTYEIDVDLAGHFPDGDPRPLFVGVFPPGLFGSIGLDYWAIVDGNALGAGVENDSATIVRVPVSWLLNTVSLTNPVQFPMAEGGWGDGTVYAIGAGVELLGTSWATADVSRFTLWSGRPTDQQVLGRAEIRPRLRRLP